MPVLVDFGLALASSGATGRDVLQVGGPAAGSPAYMAPEQMLGELVDARADLYAFGCILYEYVTGRLPFEGTVPMVINQHLHKRPAAPSSCVEGVPPALDELILKLLEKRPQDRLGYANDVAVALAALGAGERLDWPEARPYLYRPGLAGREAALADVESRLDGAATRRGARILVGGESGVGKTRFAMEVAAMATRRGMRSIAGECATMAGGEGRDAVRAAPLHPFRHLLLAVADRCRELGSPETRRLLGAHGPVLAAYEPSLLRLPGAESQVELPALPAEAALARTVSSLATTLAAFAETEELLLLIDDLQWADATSLAFLASLDAEWFARHPVVLLGTYRAEEKSDAVRQLAGAQGTLSVELGRLEPADVAGMVSDMLAMPRPPSGLLDFLVTESEGNPFFIAELLRVAIDERVLFRNETGEWRVVAEGAAAGDYHDALPLPRELIALVGRRISALSTGARALARVASVLGREFDADVLAAATTLDELPGLDAIEELRARQVLEVAGSRLRFAHDKLREAVYTAIPESQSRVISGVAARAVEARYAGTPELAGHYPFLAHHFAAAREDDKALSYLEKAGQRALDSGASADAIGFFRRAIQLDDQRRLRGDEPSSTSRRAAWERRLGQAEFNLGHMREAETLTLSSLHRCTGRVPAGRSSAVVALVVLLGHLARQLWRLVGPARHQVTRDPEARHRLTEASLAAERLSEIDHFRSEPLLSFSAALQSANLAEPLGSSPELARSYATLSIAFGLVPLQRAVDAYEARARAAAEETGDSQATSRVDLLITLSAIGTARWDVARRASDSGLDMARAAQDHRRFEEILTLRSDVEFMTGHFDEALRLNDELMVSAKKSGNRQGEFWSLTTRVWVLVLMGRAGEAVEPMERAHQLIADEVSDESQHFTRGEGALVHLMQGDHARALRIAKETLGHMERLSPSAFHVLWGYSATCEVFLELAKREPAAADRRRLARAARRACRRMWGYARIFPVGRPWAHRYDGLLHLLSGRTARAQRCFTRSLAEAERLGMPIEAAQARYELGRALPQGDRSRAELLERARAAFLEHGAGAWLARADAAIAAGVTPSMPA